MSADLGTADLLIVGGGTAATMLLRQLAALPALESVVIADPAPDLPSGLAFRHARPEHLLNVRAAQMGLRQPADFADYLQQHRGRRHDLEFVPRPWYGDYLSAHWQAACSALCARGTQLEHWSAEISGMAPAPSGLLEVRAGLATRLARTVVLCTGTGEQPPQAGSNSPYALSSERLAMAARVDPRATVLGSGLSAVDAVLSLAALGWAGPIEVHSRSARWPEVHAEPPNAPTPWNDPATDSARHLLRALRDACAQATANGADWRCTVDGLRPRTRALWQALSAAGQRQLMRHALGHWFRHRHRMPPAAAARIAELQASGQMQLVRTRVASLPARHPGALVVDARGSRGLAALAPLSRTLVAAGLARPAANGVGLDADADGRLSPLSAPAVYAIGAVLSGAWLESTAVPELRAQALTVATALQSVWSQPQRHTDAPAEAHRS